MSGQLDIDIEKGSRFELTVTIEDESIDFTAASGYSAWAQVRATAATGATLWADMDVTSVTATDGSATWTLTIASSATQAMPDPLSTPARPFRPGHWDFFAAPAASTATHAKKYLDGAAFIYPSGSLP